MNFSVSLTSFNLLSPVKKKGSIEDTPYTNVREFSLVYKKSKWFFPLLFVCQLLFTFQGVDVGDSGSYMVFYQQIFKDPVSVQYSFMFWFSGIIGGLYLNVFSFLGVWGIRLLGVIVSTSTIVITYNLLKKQLTKTNLQLSLFILVLFINNNPKEFYYNNLSAFLYIAAGALLFKGLKKNKWLSLFFCGSLISLNMFNRVPNVLGVGFIILIVLHGYLYKTAIKAQIKNSIIFIAGFFTTTMVALGIMYLLGHLPIYLNALQIVFSMGKHEELPNELANSYGIFHLIKVLNKHYLISIFSFSLLYLFVLLGLPAINNLLKKITALQPLLSISKYGIVALFISLLITLKINNITILYFFTGVSLISALLILITSKNKELLFLSLTGGFITLVHPMGSSEGIHTVIIYSLWLAFPIALDFLLKTKVIDFSIRLASSKIDIVKSFFVSESELQSVKKTTLVIMLFACLYCSYFYPYFDKHNRLQMTYSINNEHIRGLYTSQSRATALNELLAESIKYVKANDYVLAYDCIPLYHYLTSTKPYIKNPWPWLYQPSIFNKELYIAEESKPLPVVVTQIVKTMGDGGNWPDNKNPENTFTWKLNEERNIFFTAFLKKHNYKEVWTNNCFKIFLPNKS